MKNKLFIILSILSCIAIVLFFYVSGYLHQGYYMTDEHYIINTHELLKSSSFSETLKYWYNYELIDVKRMRLTYRTFLTIQTWLFGLNWTWWNVFRMLGGILCFISFYWSFSKISKSVILSFVGTLYVFIGTQSFVFFRFGPSERYAIVLLGVALVLWMLYLRKPKTVLAVGSAFCALLSALSKETFLFTIPVLAIAPYLLTEGKENFKTRFPLSISYAIALGIFALLLGIYGAEAPGYAKAENTSTIAQMLDIIKSEKLIHYNFIAFILIIIAAISCGLRKHLTLALTTLCFIAWTVPQIYVYKESGFIHGRYFLPFIVGLPLCTAVLSHNLDSSKHKQLWQLFTALVFFFLIYTNAVNPRIGQLTRQFQKNDEISKLLFDNIQQHTEPSDSILIVGDPAINFEWMSKSIPLYLEKGLAYSNIFFLPLKVDYKEHEHPKNLKKWFYKNLDGQIVEGDTIESDNYKAVIVLPSLNWFKRTFFNDNFEDFYALANSKNFRFTSRIKCGEVHLYIAKTTPVEIKGNSVFKELPVFYTHINNVKFDYKQLQYKGYMPVEYAENITVRGVVNEPVTNFYLSINDGSYVKCRIKQGKKKTEFNCYFKNIDLQANKKYPLFPIAVLPDSTGYCFMESSFQQPVIRLNK